MSDAKCKWCQLPKDLHDEPSQFEAEPDANAELLRLLERHHAEAIDEDCFLSIDTPHYYGSELYLKTEAAIERAKEVSRG